MKLTFLVPSTSKSRNWKSWDDTYLAKILLPSIDNSKHDIEVYVGYGTEDNFYMNKDNRKEIFNNIKITWFPFTNYVGNPCGIWNELAKICDSEYMFVCGDDIKLHNDPIWMDIFEVKLKSNNNMGYAAGWSNNDSIPTQFMIHQNHLKIFGFIYPPEIRNWYCDNWMHGIYPENMRYWNKEIKHLNSGGDPRYKPEELNNKQLYDLLDKYSSLINKYICEKNMRTYPPIY